MKKLFIVVVLVLLYFAVDAQLPDAMKLPDFIQPTPEVSSLVKANNLSVSYATGSPNINIPIGSLSVNGIKVPINLSYNSTGIKVDEYSSMVGAGWSCSSGGVVSRTIFDRPDEDRQLSNDPTNLDNPDFSSQNAALLNFLQNTPDAESDIFNFSFLNYSGKFILDSDLVTIIPLSTYNMKITVINNDFTNGFQIVTDDGTTYRFEDAEISKARSPQGSDCPRSYDNSHKPTSWYLTKITAPNKRSYMNFTYLTADITYEQSITQYISKCISTNYYQTGGSNSPCTGGAALAVGTETFYTCIPRQLVTSKFISTIITSANDTAAFYYDSSPREDLDAGKRLSQIKITNRNGSVINQVTLYGSYSSGSGSSSYSSYTKRLYLDSIISGTIGDSINSISYRFGYLQRSGVSGRLSFGQDIYGYSNGKSSNPSLIPILPSTDMNYSHFSSGTGASSVTFGDRSIDTAYAMKGLLNKITYPTGGYDSIIYRPNRYFFSSTDTLAGGSSVSSICSYSLGQKVMERSFSYTDTTNHSSSFLLVTNTDCSGQSTINKDGYYCTCLGCLPVFYCEGPSYTIANVSSNIITPITTLGSQHLYYRNVKEKIAGATNNGYTEHHYEFFNGGNLVPYHLMGNNVISSPLRVVSEFELGEDLTNVYRYDTGTSSYKLQKSVKNYTNYANYTTYYNYVIKRNFEPSQHGSPTPYACEFDPYDVTKYPIHKFDLYTDSTKEINYDNNNDSFIVKTTILHANSLHHYPTKQITYLPDGDTLETRMAYPLDGSASVLTARNIVSPVLEQKQYKNSSLLSTVTNTYYDWFSDSTVVALQQTEYKELTNSMPAHIKYINYDTLGNVLEIAKDSGLHKSYIWGYNKQMPIAAATNAAANEIFYTGFEEASGTTDADAKTGGKSHSGNYTVSFTLPNGKSYLLTYWAWDGSKWVYTETAYTGPTATITTSYKIDEVRVYPADAQMVTFSYEPMLGITSQCDARNQVSYFEYDPMNRLKLIRDENRNIIKMFDYKYPRPHGVTIDDGY